MSDLSYQGQLDDVLFQACLKGPLEAVKNAIKAGGNVRAKNNTGATPLHWAVFSRNTSIAKYLIEVGADSRDQDQDGKTALDWAEESKPLKNYVLINLLQQAMNREVA